MKESIKDNENKETTPANNNEELKKSTTPDGKLNKESDDPTEPGATETPAPPTPPINETPKTVTGYTLTPEGINEVADMINQLVPGKYAKKAFFDGINTVITPVFDLPEDK